MQVTGKIMLGVGLPLFLASYFAGPPIAIAIPLSEGVSPGGLPALAFIPFAAGAIIHQSLPSIFFDIDAGTYAGVGAVCVGFTTMQVIGFTMAVIGLKLVADAKGDAGGASLRSRVKGQRLAARVPLVVPVVDRDQSGLVLAWRF